jgi:hypothetical protein
MTTNTFSSHLVYLNGEFVLAHEAKISVFDAAVMLGDTVTKRQLFYC